MAEKIDMGIGKLGDPKTIFKRRNRFQLAISTPCGEVPSYFVKSASKPVLETEEIEVPFLNAMHYVPGRYRWAPITVTYYDVANKEMEGLYNWVSTLHYFNKKESLAQSEKSGWSGTGVLSTHDGCGKMLERWTLYSILPTRIDFGGQLDMESAEIANIELTFRFADAFYEGFCGVKQLKNCCTGCEPSNFSIFGQL